MLKLFLKKNLSFNSYKPALCTVYSVWKSPKQLCLLQLQ